MLFNRGRKGDVPHCLGQISQLLGRLDKVHNSVQNSVQCTMKFSVQYNIGVWGVQKLVGL